MMLQNLGQGYSGVRLEVLEACRDFLNKGVVPVVPQSGSVGYLALEGHVALVLMGKGKAWYKGELLDGKEALERAGMTPLTLSSKEGLALVSGTTSPTAMAASPCMIFFRQENCRCDRSPVSGDLERRDECL